MVCLEILFIDCMGWDGWNLLIFWNAKLICWWVFVFGYKLIHGLFYSLRFCWGAHWLVTLMMFCWQLGLIYNSVLGLFLLGTDIVLSWFLAIYTRVLWWLEFYNFWVLIEVSDSWFWIFRREALYIRFCFGTGTVSFLHRFNSFSLYIGLSTPYTRF